MSGEVRNTILVGDVSERLRQLPGASVDCVVTSPPYFLLRDYQTEGQLGLEPTVEAWVESLRAVMAEIARVMKPAGSVWLNLGDSYSRDHKYGAPPKSLLMAPERLALALITDGWVLRNKVTWSKPNPMPSSVGDRLSCTWEVVYHFVRARHYFYDLDAIREPHRSGAAKAAGTMTGRPAAWAGPLAGSQDGLRRAREAGTPGHVLGKNPGDVWTIATRGYRGAHFATFPPALVRRPILATCPEAICTACGEPWRRRVTLTRTGETAPTPRDYYVLRFSKRWETLRQVGELLPCPCGARALPGLVLDPFLGSGTTALVARELGRDWLGIELSRAYAEMARERVGGDPPVRYERAAVQRSGLDGSLAPSEEDPDDHHAGGDQVRAGGSFSLLLLFLGRDGEGSHYELERKRVLRRNHFGYGGGEDLAVHGAEEAAQAETLLLGGQQELFGQGLRCRRRGGSVGREAVAGPCLIQPPKICGRYRDEALNGRLAFEEGRDLRLPRVHAPSLSRVCNSSEQAFVDVPDLTDVLRPVVDPIQEVTGRTSTEEVVHVREELPHHRHPAR